MHHHLAFVSADLDDLVDVFWVGLGENGGRKAHKCRRQRKEAESIHSRMVKDTSEGARNVRLRAHFDQGLAFTVGRFYFVQSRNA
jgi:hypothetical protein